MIVADIKVSDVNIQTIYNKIIPAGIVGAQIQLNYMTDIWNKLHKTVVFKGGAVTKDVVTDDSVVTIPPEVVAEPNSKLLVGVYGVDVDGNIAVPTLWACFGYTRDAANPSGDTSTDPSLPVWAQLQAMIGDLDKLDTTAKENLVVAVNEAMTKGGGEVDPAEIQRIVNEYLAANPPTATETDPTVPAWAKQPTKPTYTAAEVGALPDTYTPPNQTAQQVGADPAGTAASAVSQHNTDTTAHNDLRLALQELANRINAALDSDDTTLDQMSEVVAYIKSNKSLIDAITTSKVGVADIVNDLVTNVTDKPLSAAQGVALKQLIDDLQAMIPEGGSGISVSGATVGQTIKIAAVDDDGVPTAWEPVDLPIGGVSDVQINSASVVTDGVAAIPLANGNDTYGMVNQAKSEYYCGISIVNGKISCDFESQGNGEEWLVLRVRNQNYSIPFLAKGFDLMVKHAMCDTGTDTSGYGKPLIWSDAERISALLRLGCTVDDNGFVKWAAQEVAE